MQAARISNHSRRKSQTQSTTSSSNSNLPAEHGLQRSAFVSFIQVDAGEAGVSDEARRAVRVQAARSSAAARKRTIARRLALKRGSVDEGKQEPTDDITRHYSLPSPLLTEPESAVSSTTASAESSPTLSLISQSEISQGLYPTSLRHDEIPAVIEYFLDHFAPARDANVDFRGRELWREYLWPQALRDQSLFHSCLLVAGSHACATRALHVPMTLLSQAKHIALASINLAISRSLPNEQVEEPIIVAITLLAGWELEYGDPETYETHMRGLQTIIQLRGGLFPDIEDAHRSGADALSAVTVNAILSVGHNLAIYAWRQPYFSHPEFYVPALPPGTPTTLSDGLRAMSDQQLFQISLLRLIGMLHDLDPSTSTPPAVLWPRVVTIQQALQAWDPVRVHAVSFCPLQTDFEDRLNGNVHRLTRLAGLALCYRLLEVSSSPSISAAPSGDAMTTDRASPRKDTCDTAQSLVNAALRIDSESLIGTVYDEITLWSLFAICAATSHWSSRGGDNGNYGGRDGGRGGSSKHVRVLRRLVDDLDISSWDAFRSRIMGQYVGWLAYEDDEEKSDSQGGPETHGVAGNSERPSESHPAFQALRASARALWNTVKKMSTSRESSGELGSIVSPSDRGPEKREERRQLTRYAKSIPHPTLQIGQAIREYETQTSIEVPTLRPG